MKKLLIILLAAVGSLIPMEIWAQDKAYEPYFNFNGDSLMMYSDTENAMIIYVMEEFSSDTSEDVLYQMAENLDVNQNGTFYSEPILVTKNVIIKAVAFRQGLEYSDPTVLIYDYSKWQLLVSAIEYGSNVFQQALNHPAVEQQKLEELQWALDEGHHIYMERGMMPDSHEAEHFAQQIIDIASEIEALMGQPGQPEPYAVLSDNNTVLTFYYDDQKTVRGGMDINNSYINDMSNSPYGTATTAVFDASFADYQPTSTAHWFENCSLLTSITGMENLKTDNVTDMKAMFESCYDLTSLNLSGFNTQNVTDMYCMFYNCISLTSLDVSNFNTQNVTNMDHMFFGCICLTSLNLSSFNTSNVTKYTEMFYGCSSLASIQAGNANFPAEEYARIGNPNLLVYVNEPSLAPQGVQNVVINGQAKEIILTDATSGNNNFFCPEPFMAEKISYTRNFQQRSEIGVSRGWEGLALPFNVQTITHETHGELAPFAAGNNSAKPFWLRYYTGDKVESAHEIEAYVPYVIAMPNSNDYFSEYNQAGKVTFSAINTEVYETPDFSFMENEPNMSMMTIPTFQLKAKSDSIYAINVSQPRNDFAEGSVFESGLRDVRPFEIYTVHHGQGARPRFIPIPVQGNESTGIETIENNPTEGSWYSLDGRKLLSQPKTKGVYIQKGRKVIR